MTTTSSLSVHRQGKVNKLVVFSVIILLAVVGTVGVRHFYRSLSAHVDLKPDQALGQVTADETAKLLNNGGQVLVIAEDSIDALLPTQIAAFKSALKHRRGITVKAVERLKPMDPWLRTMNPGGPSCPPEEFIRALGKYSQINAVVSFIGLPIGDSPELATLKQRGCKIIVVFNSNVTPELSKAIESHLIDLAIVLREVVPPSKGASPKTARKYFDRYYAILKAN